MKIAFFADNFYPELSGIADSILLTGFELANRGHEVDYFVPAYSEKNYKIAGVSEKEIAAPPNVQTHRMFSFPYPTPTLQGRFVFPDLLRGFLEKKKFDVIHSNSFFGPGIDALCFSKIRGIPLVGTNHTLIESFLNYSPIKGEWAKKMISKYVVWYFNKCDIVTAPSRFLIDDMRSKGLKSEASVVSNPVAPRFFERAEKEKLKKKFGFPRFVALYAGRMSEEKNIHSLIKAFIPFAEKHEDTALILVGQGTSRRYLENLAAERGLSDKIKFLGPFLGSEKQTFYDIFRASDVFAMPSSSETQSMGAIQAMAAGLPVIAADAGALPEIVGPDKGLLFKVDDEKELYSRLERFYSDEDLRKKCGENGRLFAGNFSIGKIADEWEKIFLNLIQRKKKT